MYRGDGNINSVHAAAYYLYRERKALKDTKVKVINNTLGINKM